MRVLSLISVVFAVAVSTATATVSYPFRRLHPQADKKKCTSLKESPFASMIGDIPDFAGLQGCLLSNLEDLLPLLTAKETKCSLKDLTSLLSKENEDVNAFQELFNVISSTFTGSNKEEDTSAQQLFTSWAKEQDKTKDFCSTMNEKIGPCMDTLIPNLIQVIEKDSNGCCQEINQYVEFIKLIVPNDKQVSSHLMTLFQSVHLTLCTEIDDEDELCGHKIVQFLSESKANAPFLLEASVPLYAMSKDEVCDNLDSTDEFTSSVNSKTKIKFTDLSCCAIYMVPLLNTFDTSLQHLTGNSAVELMNLMAGLQDQEDTNKFTNLVDTIEECTFKAKCTKPNFEWTNIPTDKPKLNDDAVVQKLIEPKEIVCDFVEKCDEEDVCRQVCEEKSVHIAPWLDRAIHFQLNQTFTQSKVCNMQLPGSHNSYNNVVNGFGVRDVVLNQQQSSKQEGVYTRTNNQFFSIVDQLNLGARFIELDVHYFGKELKNGHCSGLNIKALEVFTNSLADQLSLLLAVNRNKLPWSTSLIGCLPSLSGISSQNQPLHVDNLKKIADWLKENPKELIFLYTEMGDEIEEFDQVDNLLDLYMDTFDQDILFTPKDLKNKKWTDLSLQELIEDNKQIVLLATPEKNELMFDLDNICDGWSNIPTTSSKSDENGFWGLEMNQGKLVRAYHSVLHYGPYTEDEMDGKKIDSTDERPGTVDAKTLPLFTQKGVNILAPDALDGQVFAGMVWSWAPKEPSNDDVLTEMSSKDGRWYGRQEDETKAKWTACVNEEDRDKWTLVEFKKECTKGYKKSTPVSVFENSKLLSVLQDKAAGSKDEVFVQLSIDPRDLPRISQEDEEAFEKNKVKGSSDSYDDDQSNKTSFAPIVFSSTSRLLLVIVVSIILSI